MSFVGCAFSQRGANHLRTNKPCEDAAGYFINEKLGAQIAVVADGHGGDRYFRSRCGAELAIAVAPELITEFIAAIPTAIAGAAPGSAAAPSITENDFAVLTQEIVTGWRAEVLRHIQKNPWTPAELAFCETNSLFIPTADNPNELVRIYGATCLVAAVTEDFWLVLQIGDGAAVIVGADGIAEFAVPDDERQGFGITQSLCGDNAAEDFRYAYGWEKILGAVIATDGVIDSYPREKYLHFIAAQLLKNFIEQPVMAQIELQAFLPILSAKGNGDDVSFGVIFNQTAAQKNRR